MQRDHRSGAGFCAWTREAMDFNKSPGEFNNGKQGSPFWRASYPMKLAYAADDSGPEADWAARQLGPPIFQSGGHPRHYTTRFDLAKLPRGSLTSSLWERQRGQVCSIGAVWVERLACGSARASGLLSMAA